MIKTIEFKDKVYPAFQASGNAARFIMPFALEVCTGQGLDIGYNKPEWKFPGAVGIDYKKLHEDGDSEFYMDSIDAMNLPDKIREGGSNQWDYIFSSHCLEHLEDWVGVLNRWYKKLKTGGVLFLYLPHPDQQYWLPHNNRKHVNILYPRDIKKYMKDKGYKNIFVSKRDLNHSFAIFGEKIN